MQNHTAIFETILKILLKVKESEKHFHPCVTVINSGGYLFWLWDNTTIL